MTNINIKYSPREFSSKEKIKWCPGCGDYAILNQIKIILSTIGIKKENIVFVSGIGCSSRLPYYLNTYGLHGIHGRATSIATGIKLANKKLSVWIITGDGDALAIGTNQLIHAIRRNINFNILLFNNEIYGLTKGQYSPTTKINNNLIKKNKINNYNHYPLNPLLLALGAQSSFIARTLDVKSKHLNNMLLRAYNHIGTSFLEIYQNCNIFNDGAFNKFLDKKNEYSLFVEDNKPMTFGEKNLKGIRLNGLQPEIINLKNSNFSINDLWIHNEKDRTKADILLRLNINNENFPTPFGVIYTETRSCYDKLFYNNNNYNQNFDFIINNL